MTDITYTLTRGSEEYELTVDYACVYRGFAGSYNDPPEAPEFEVRSVYTEAPPWAYHKYPWNCLDMPLTPTEWNELYAFISENGEID